MYLHSTPICGLDTAYLSRRGAVGKPKSPPRTAHLVITQQAIFSVLQPTSLHWRFEEDTCHCTPGWLFLSFEDGRLYCLEPSTQSMTSLYIFLLARAKRITALLTRRGHCIKDLMPVWKTHDLTSPNSIENEDAMARGPGSLKPSYMQERNVAETWEEGDLLRHLTESRLLSGRFASQSAAPQYSGCAALVVAVVKQRNKQLKTSQANQLETSEKAISPSLVMLHRLRLNQCIRANEIESCTLVNSCPPKSDQLSICRLTKSTKCSKYIQAAVLHRETGISKAKSHSLSLYGQSSANTFTNELLHSVYGSC